MNDSSRANKLHADTGKMHLGKRKTERKRSEATERERCGKMFYLYEASERNCGVLALESTKASITITKEIAHSSLTDTQ